MDEITGDLALYHAWVSSASRRVRFALEEKEIAYQGILVNLLAFEQHTPAYIAINPNGVVPTAGSSRHARSREQRDLRVP